MYDVHCTEEAVDLDNKFYILVTDVFGFLLVHSI